MFFPFIWPISVSVYDAFVFRRARQLTNISAEQERFTCQRDRQCRFICACIQHWCMPNFYSMINARFIERRTDANRRDILSSHDKNKKSNTCTQPHTRAHSVLRVCDYWAFLVFLCHKCAQASFFFFNHWIRAWWNHIGWCLSQMLSTKVQGSLCFCAIASGNSKFWSGWRI